MGGQTQEVAVLLEKSHRVLLSSSMSSPGHSEATCEEKKARNKLDRNESASHSVGHPCSQFCPDGDRMAAGEIKTLKLEL